MPRDFSIAGQAPKVKWKRNRRGKKRTIEEAIAIAKANGVVIPEDVDFVEAEAGELKGNLRGLFAGEAMETARGPEVREQPDGCVYWMHHLNDRDRICFRVHPDILTSDEAIVGTLQHELFELAELREVFAYQDGRMNATDYGLQVAPGKPGNFHDQAWDAADRAVRRMREAGP